MDFYLGLIYAETRVSQLGTQSGSRCCNAHCTNRMAKPSNM